jgi:hypothetical protein
VALLACPTAAAQAPETLRAAGVMPGGVRHSATESWGSFDILLTNLTDTDRQARVFVSYAARPDVQYGRDLWVPAHATLATWMLVGPAAAEPSAMGRTVLVRLYDHSDGYDRPLRPGDEQPRARGVLYRPRELSTTILVDDDGPEETVFGRLPQPDSPAEEAVRLVRTARLAADLSAAVTVIHPGSLPPTPEAFNGIDHFVIASEKIADDPAGMRALRQWLERGGTVWVMLDLVDPQVVAPLLGEALDFQVADRVTLNTVTLETPSSGQNAPERTARQQHERPVNLAQVVLPRGERLRHTADGWPAWFTRQVGRGKVVYTTVGPRGWFRPRGRFDPSSPYDNNPSLPIPTKPLEVMASELRPPPPDAKPFDVEAFRPMLTEEIGYTVVSRTTVGLVFAALLAATLVLRTGLRRARQREVLGWIGPAAALLAAGAFLALGEASRRSAPPTVAVAQVVDAVPGTAEAPVHGLLAVYRPDPGPVDVGAPRGGLFELDLTGVEGQTRRFVLTDTDSWYRESLALPAGVRTAPFHYTAPTTGPLSAVGRFGPEGLEGRVAAGGFRDVTDALLGTPGGRNLEVRLGPDGTFRTGSADVLPAGHFLAGAVLSDRQQRREALYREFLKRPAAGVGRGGSVLLAWAEPIDMHFALLPGARTVGGALLAIPLRLERPPPGTRVTVPGPLVPYQRIWEAGPTKPTLESDQPANMHLRFQLPAAVLPLRVERARLLARIDAPGRRVTVAGRAGDEVVELYQVESPLDPIHVEITEERLLRPDGEGGLHLNVALSAPPRDEGSRPGARGAGEKWTIEYLELEVTGRAE